MEKEFIFMVTTVGYQNGNVSFTTNKLFKTLEKAFNEFEFQNEYHKELLEAKGKYDETNQVKPLNTDLKEFAKAFVYSTSDEEWFVTRLTKEELE